MLNGEQKKIIEENMHLAKWAVKSFNAVERLEQSPEDVLQIAYLAMCVATLAYNPAKCKCKYSTYVCQAIKNAFNQAARYKKPDVVNLDEINLTVVTCYNHLGLSVKDILHKNHNSKDKYADEIILNMTADGYTVKEIAAVVNYTNNAVAKRQMRIRNTMKQFSYVG